MVSISVVNAGDLGSILSQSDSFCNRFYLPSTTAPSLIHIQPINVEDLHVQLLGCEANKKPIRIAPSRNATSDCYWFESIQSNIYCHRQQAQEWVRENGGSVLVGMFVIYTESDKTEKYGGIYNHPSFVKPQALVIPLCAQVALLNATLTFPVSNTLPKSTLTLREIS